MKIIFKTLLIACVSTLIMSCSSDDDQPAPEEKQNFLKVGSEQFELKSGIIEDFGSTQNLHNFDITLYSVETTIEDNEGIGVGEPETVSAIYFELFTDNAEDINVGSYEYVDFNDRSDFTYTFADTAINLIIDGDDQDESFVEIQNGTLEILSNGATYQLEFSGVDVQDRQINMYYEGALGLIDARD